MARERGRGALMAQRRPKAAILGSRIGRPGPQTRSLFDEPARSLPPDKCPVFLLQGPPEPALPFWCPPLFWLKVSKVSADNERLL